MFKINGRDWKLFFVSSNHPMLRRSNGTYTIGACDDGTSAIYISENITSTLTKKVLCHEITHAAMFSYGVTLTIDQEELLADLIATYGQEIICTTNKIFHRIKENWGAD